MKYWRLILIGFGIPPITFTIAILSFYFHAAKIIGRLPSYDQPDPKNLEIYNNYNPFITKAIEIWAYSFPIWFILTILYIILKRKNINWFPVIISGIGQIIGISIFFSEVLEWYAD